LRHSTQVPYTAPARAFPSAAEPPPPAYSHPSAAHASDDDGEGRSGSTSADRTDPGSLDGAGGSPAPRDSPTGAGGSSGGGSGGDGIGGDSNGPPLSAPYPVGYVGVDLPPATAPIERPPSPTSFEIGDSEEGGVAGLPCGSSGKPRSKPPSPEQRLASEAV
jgi:hypothetical protein